MAFRPVAFSQTPPRLLQKSSLCLTILSRQMQEVFMTLKTQCLIGLVGWAKMSTNRQTGRLVSAAVVCSNDFSVSQMLILSHVKLTPFAAWYVFVWFALQWGVGVMAAGSGLDYKVAITGVPDDKLRTTLEDISYTVLLRKERPPMSLALLRRRAKRDIPSPRHPRRAKQSHRTVKETRLPLSPDCRAEGDG